MPKVLATDLDGTLFYPKRPICLIPRKSLKLVRAFIAEDNHFVLVTGRSPFYTTIVEEKVGHKLDVIGMNGAYIIINGEVVEETFLDFDIRSVLDDIDTKFGAFGMMLMSKRYPLLISLPKISKRLELFYRFYYWSQGVYSERYYFSNELYAEEIRGKTVYKLMVYFGMTKRNVKKASDATKYLRENYGDVLEASWTGGFVEITPKGCSKANGIEKYLKIRNIDKEQLFVVGDSGNDISMFKEFHENSFCMSHSPNNVKKHAKTIIRRFHNLSKYILKETK